MQACFKKYTFFLLVPILLAVYCTTSANATTYIDGRFIRNPEVRSFIVENINLAGTPLSPDEGMCELRLDDEHIYYSMSVRRYKNAYMVIDMCISAPVLNKDDDVVAYCYFAGITPQRPVELKMVVRTMLYEEIFDSSYYEHPHWGYSVDEIPASRRQHTAIEVASAGYKDYTLQTDSLIPQKCLIEVQEDEKALIDCICGSRKPSYECCTVM